MVVRASDNGPARRPQRWTLHSIPIDESVVASAPVAPDTGPDLEAEAGARVLGGRYVLLELLCHGDLGGVYLGRDRVQNRSIEVKLLSPGAAESTATVAYLRSRARRMFGIRHAHVASVYDEALDEDGVPFFVTEHVEGRNLHHMQGDARLTGAAVQAIALQLAEGLAALHGRSVVHGAITPGNIVWLEDDTRPVQIKLVDREVSPGNAESGGYRSPGAAQNAPDEAADLYALAAVVYELCTGRLPYSDPDSEPRMRGEDLPITVTEAFEAILLDLLRPDATARSSGGAKALVERLTTVVGPPPPRPPPRSEPASPAADEFAAFADEWLDANSADAELTRFRPVEDGPAPPPPAAEPEPEPTPEPTPTPEPAAESLTSAEYTELGAGDLAAVSVSALVAAPLMATSSSTSSVSSTSALASASSVLNSAIASSSAALTGPTVGEWPSREPVAAPPMEPRSFAVREPRVQPAATPEPVVPAREPRDVPPKAPWRLIAAIGLGALLVIVIWQLSRGEKPSEPPVETPIATPQTTAKAPERPAETTLARTQDLPALPVAEPTPPAEPAPAPAPAPAETAAAAAGERPEQLSAGEFRKVLLRANRLGSTRTCYRRHSSDSDRSVELIAIVGADGRVQKLKMERTPLADCLRKVVLGLEFSTAQKTAQHNFVFHHPDVDQSG
jgi:serine/threonine protein kinase